jgi:predicted GNAT family acetyltransferase
VVGFITVKAKSDHVSIGLLAVSPQHRRKGIAQRLLSRAVMWGLEELGWRDDAFIEVITQGANDTACNLYERFGFTKTCKQQVFHCWLPDHLVNVSRADRPLIPFCRQHITGRERDCVDQVLQNGLDSAAHYTTLVSKFYLVVVLLVLQLSYFCLTCSMTPVGSVECN